MTCDKSAVFLGGARGKEPPSQCRRCEIVGLISRLGKSPGVGYRNPFQYTCRENPRGRGDWWATVHGVTKSRTQLKQLSMHSYMNVGS